MCTYEKENGKQPCCTHECEGCVWHESDENEDNDYEYDPCYECRGLGDDYIVNDEGELESWCDKCGVNPDRIKDDT